VARPKVCANLQVLRPSERQWKPRLRQALARYLQWRNSDSAYTTKDKVTFYFSQKKIDTARKIKYSIKKILPLQS